MSSDAVYNEAGFLPLQMEYVVTINVEVRSGRCKMHI